MIDAPPTWGGFGDPEPEQPTFAWKALSDIPVRPIVWVEYPFLQGAAFHLLAGVKNSGKGTWLASVAARITSGALTGRPQRVLWLALGEDSYATDVRPRVEAAGGDPAGVVVLDGYGFKLPDHAQMLDDKVREVDAGVVIVDPLGGAVLGESSADWNVRPSLAALNILADQTGTMVFGVRHISNKAGKRGEGVLSGILGSSDWVNIPRAVLALVHDDVDAQVRHLFAVTGNRGPSDTPGLMLRIESATMAGQEYGVALARTLGESHKDPDELLTVKRARRTTRSDAAEILVLSTLQEKLGGQMETDALDAEIARRTGLVVKTIRNVRNEMRNRGLIRAIPVKDGEEKILHWMAAITNAGIVQAEAAAEAVMTNADAPTAEVSSFNHLSLTASGVSETRSGAREAHEVRDLVFGAKVPANSQNPSLKTTGSGSLQGFLVPEPQNGAVCPGDVPEPPDHPDPVEPKNTGSGRLQGFSDLSVQTPEEVSVQTNGASVHHLHDFERRYWERRNAQPGG